MKKNLFLMILCMLGFFGTLKAQNEVTIDGTVGGFEQGIIDYVPIYNNYEYAVTQFYYTVDEIGKANGTIESIAFKTSDKGAYPYTRKIDVYMVNTDKYYFSPEVGSGKQMEQVSSNDLVFSSGEDGIEFASNSWVTIDLDKDFEYTGGNLLVCVNDYTGTYISGDENKSQFEVYVSTYTVQYQGSDALARRALYQRSTNTKQDPTASAISAYSTSKYVPFAKLKFVAGTAEEFVEPSTPTNLVATPLSESKVQLTWDALTENVQSYKLYCGTDVVAEGLTETTYVVKNLNPGEYSYTVTAVNGSYESAASEPATVTLVEKELESVVIGTCGDVDASAVPFGNTANNSWVEHVYTAEEIGKACTIEKISFPHKSGDPITTKEIKIYLAETTKTSYEDKAWTAEEDLKLVYSDTDIIIGEQEWETFELTTPFEYSGENNLAVVVAKSSEETNGLLFWYCTEVANSSLIATETSEYPAATTQSAAYGKRPVVKFSYSGGEEGGNEGDENEGDENEGDEEAAYLIKEYFDGFAAGDKIAEKGSAWWTTWDKKPGSETDGVIAEIDGDLCAHFTYGNDQVLLLGGHQAGVYELEFDILVPEGKHGYFNILHDFKGSSSTWAMQGYLHMTDDGTDNGQKVAEGQGSVHAGATANGNVVCIYDAWMHFRLLIDTDADTASYYYTAPDSEEVFVCGWQWSKDSFGETVVGRKLDAVNFYPPLEASEYYLDNFTLKKIGGDSAADLTFDSSKLEGEVAKDDITSVEISFENTGTSVAEYVAWVDYGMGELSETDDPIFVNYDEDTDEPKPWSVNPEGEPLEIEIAAMFPAESYGNSVAGTYITHMTYPFYQLVVNNSIGIEEGTDVKFRIYGQGLYGQPGQLLAEKVVTYAEVLAAVNNQENWVFAEFDEPVALTGYNVWAAVAMTHAVSTEENPQAPLFTDGAEEAAAYGDMFRFLSSGPFYKASESWGQNIGNFQIRMICFGTPVTGGWAELDKAEGMMPIGAEETITIDLSSIGLKGGETYEANLVFSTNVPEKELIEIPLSLYVFGEDVEEILSDTYNIYPNPTTGMVTVEGENINYIVVYNSVGQLVNVVNNSNNVVDMSNYDNGVYYFNVVDNAGANSVQRVVVAK